MRCGPPSSGLARLPENENPATPSPANVPGKDKQIDNTPLFLEGLNNGVAEFIPAFDGPPSLNKPAAAVGP
jgi:hypothetical protein